MIIVEFRVIELFFELLSIAESFETLGDARTSMDPCLETDFEDVRRSSSPTFSLRSAAASAIISISSPMRTTCSSVSKVARARIEASELLSDSPEEERGTSWPSCAKGTGLHGKSVIMSSEILAECRVMLPFFEFDRRISGLVISCSPPFELLPTPLAMSFETLADCRVIGADFEFKRRSSWLATSHSPPFELLPAPLIVDSSEIRGE